MVISWYEMTNPMVGNGYGMKMSIILSLLLLVVSLDRMDHNQTAQNKQSDPCCPIRRYFYPNTNFEITIFGLLQLRFNPLPHNTTV